MSIYYACIADLHHHNECFHSTSCTRKIKRSSATYIKQLICTPGIDQSHPRKSPLKCWRMLFPMYDVIPTLCAKYENPNFARSLYTGCSPKLETTSILRYMHQIYFPGAHFSGAPINGSWDMRHPVQ